MTADLLWALGYLSASVVAGSVAVRWIAVAYAAKPRCHGEPRHRASSSHVWTDEANCRDLDKPDCWRADGEPSLQGHEPWVLLGVLWPLLLPAWLALTLAGSRPLVPVDKSLDGRIAALERENGIGQ